jgi:hypothetical protein
MWGMCHPSKGLAYVCIAKMQGTMIHLTKNPAHAGFITFESLFDKVNPFDRECTVNVNPLFTGATTLRQGESVEAQVFVIDRYQPEHYSARIIDWPTGARTAEQSGGTMLLAWIKTKGSIYTLFGVYLAARHAQGRLTNHVRMFGEMVKTGSKSNLYTFIKDALNIRLELIRSEKGPPGLQSLPLACWFEWEPSSRYQKHTAKPLPPVPAASTGSNGSTDSVSGAYTTSGTMFMPQGGKPSLSDDRTEIIASEESCLPWSSWIIGDWWPCLAPSTSE